ncbi:cell division protein ZapB [uncultured Corynebacterium sp.]|uniref:cell division protein ZapB n=1 Tax=uncultured Corynebacterium sp. TaxID=159447 RepID=UPI0025E33A0B|nr:cell division protein ZapB [uncultured Corynebacterium sp.]
MNPAPPPPPFRSVDSTTDVAALAAALCAPPDMTPTLVATAENRSREVPLDLRRIADEVGDAARLVVITDPSLTRALTGLMPPGTTPYNGAARIYPAHDLTWMEDCFAGDLLFANIRPDNGTRVAGALAARLLTVVENARGYEALADRASDAVAEDAGPRPFRGEFTGASSATVGMITSPDAPGLGMLRVDLDTLLPGAPVVIGSVFADGDEVSGHFDASGAVTDVSGLRAVERMAADLVVQHCYPAVVTGVVAKSQVGVQVVPGVTSHLTQAGVDVTAEVGAVVAVQVQSVGERRGSLRIIVGPAPEGAGVDAAPPLRTGGPAWVSMTVPSAGGAGADNGRGNVAEDSPGTVPGGAAGGVPAGSVAELEGLRARVPQLKKHLRRMEGQIDELQRQLRTYDDERRYAWDENDRLEDENDLLRARLRAAGVALPDGAASGEAVTAARAKKTEKRTVYTERPLMGDEFDTLYWQLYTEVQLCWARQVDAADKREHPLAFRYGEGFLASVSRTVKDSEALRWKLPKVMAWIGCGLPERTTRHHAYRDGEGGGAPQLVRDDGAKAFRVDLETNTAAARRLHYWKLPDGTVEFARVGFHDEPGF